MKSPIALISVLAAVSTMLFSGVALEQQAAQKTKLESRVDTLEKRITLLESVTFTSAKVASVQAQRQLDEANERLKNSQALFRRGLINELQLRDDRFRVESALKAVELAQTDNRQQELVGELELLDAENRLRTAKQELKYQESLLEKGFATRSAVDRLRLAADQAARQLEVAKMKLEAAKKLESIKEK